MVWVLACDVLSEVRYNQSELELKHVNGTELMTETSVLWEMQLQSGDVQWKKPLPSLQETKGGRNGWWRIECNEHSPLFPSSPTACHELTLTYR